MWYAYFLELSNGHLHVGPTNDLKRRVKSHSNGQVVLIVKNKSLANNLHFYPLPKWLAFSGGI
jgi:predicted GIY-YIG superfamily endonuclease